MAKLALVLSGGGSKGAYEIGVYKALRKLHKKIDITTGTSIGAVNAMFVAQNDLYGALKFWKNISFKMMFDENAFVALESDPLSHIYAEYAKNFINEGGLDIYKMKDCFPKFFHPFFFYHSNIDYGLVTYNVTQNKPVFKFKKDLTKDNIKDYILASASCYPAFKPYEIDNELYVDGGYFDNIPINLAVEMGATEVIAVDLRAVGFKKILKDKSIEVTYIAPRNNIGSFLVFDKNQAKHAIKLGYNDAMKTFNKLDGDKFTFKKHNLVANYNRYGNNFENNLKNIFDANNNKILNKIFSTSAFKDILNGKTLYNNFNQIIEKAGQIFNFEEYVIYNISSYNNGLLNALSNTDTVATEKIINQIKDKKFNKIIDNRHIVKYFYEKIIAKDETMIKYIPFFINEFLVALYIYTIKGNYKIY
jgi:NTE family protein